MSLDERAPNSAPAPSADKSAAVRRRVVDADAHLDPPYEMWASYLPTRLRELAPRVEAGPDHDWIVFEGRRKPVMMISNQAGRTGKEYKMFGRRSEMRKVWLPEQRLFLPLVVAQLILKKSSIRRCEKSSRNVYWNRRKRLLYSS